MIERYPIERLSADCQPLALAIDRAPWQAVRSVALDQFHRQSTDHRPQQAKLAYSPDALHVIFRVRDRFVTSLATQYQEMVCSDSCVELFIQPKATQGYFNFEINCGGTMLIYCIEDATRVGNAFARYTKVSPGHAAMISVATTMPKTTPVEITEPIEWCVALRMPFAMMEPYVGPIGDVRGQTWRGNLYKCGDQTSHPHWASWAPIGEELNFHQPEKFGELQFV